MCARQQLPGLRDHAGEPATVAFRRPADTTGGAAIGTLEQRWDVPLVLSLPDVNAPVSLPAAPLAEASNPLVGKLMWAATGVLAIVAIWLVATGRPPKTETLPAAPAWTSADTAAPLAQSSLESAALHPVPNWKAPHDAGTPNRIEPSNNRGPWRAGAQVIQPGANSDIEPEAADKSTAPGTASWPGDAWPGRRADAEHGAEPAVVPPAENYRELSPGDSPAAEPADGLHDPWPGDPQWPAGAQNGTGANSADLRTAQRPAVPVGAIPGGAVSGVTAPQRRPEARLQGGIQNMDVSPSYDGTRSSIH